MASNDDIMRAIGRIEARMDAFGDNLGHLREDFSTSEDRAHESRGSIHRRLDEQASEISMIRLDVAVSGKIEAQLRDKVDQLSDTVDKNHASVTPALDDWRRVKFLGWGVGILFLSLGISAASIYAWAWDWAQNLMRVWLR